MRAMDFDLCKASSAIVLAPNTFINTHQISSLTVIALSRACHSKDREADS